MLIRNMRCQTAREPKGGVQYVFLGNFIIIMVRHINNIPPLGGKNNLEVVKKWRKKKERKLLCWSLTYHLPWEVIETDACALASFKDSQKIDVCLPKPLKQL